MKNSIEEKPEAEKVGLQDIKIEVKPDYSAEYENMRFIKHPTILIPNDNTASSSKLSNSNLFVYRR